MSGTWSALRGSAWYEARMAARGRVLWLSLAPLTALAVLLALSSPAVMGVADPAGRVGTAVLVVTTFAVVGVGVALAGRLTQHTRPGLADLLDTTPARRTTRMSGVLAGALGVALAPVFLVVLLLGAVVAVQAGQVSPLVVAVVGALTVVLPAAVAITAFACLLGLLLPVALARVLVVAAWFWATQLSPAVVPIPTPTGTVLSPLGGYQAVAWLGARGIWADRDQSGPLSPAASSGTAVLNLVLVLACAVLFFLAARVVVAWRAGGRATGDGVRTKEGVQ
ncbi:hypothetical protein [Actinokineospora diospyrosa]|uniref:ABC-2 type transport system permease protein n=1 Tax=Actinokineospora diospyrosa TaxID=103728 RepID=A0ABT1IG21_9PSEU|nr:hypothetical protein [Actinokineospora diospyrosa]MCP2271559.1 ABC-2 type transport system permease protein [Actinokineospora diospyrosa]